jgi:hypothetical protein
MGELSGVRLRLARDAEGKLIGTTVLGLEPEPFSRPLTCPDRRCAAPLVPVREHGRTDNVGDLVTVSAHFRLAPAAHHLSGCVFDPAQLLATIAEESGGAVRAASGKVRLLLPSIFSSTTEGTAPPPFRSRRRPRRQRRQAPTPAHAINSAAAIQRFLDRYPDDEIALDLFDVSIGTRRIPWRDFCLGTHPDLIVGLAERLAEGLAPSHLIAIHGTVTGSGTARTGTTVYAEHDLRRKLEISSRRRWLYVRLRSHDPRLLDPLGLGRRFMAIGDWELFNPEAARVAELVLWVRKPWQVAAWDDDKPRTTSEPSTPRNGSATEEAAAEQPRP